MAGSEQAVRSHSRRYANLPTGFHGFSEYRRGVPLQQRRRSRGNATEARGHLLSKLAIARQLNVWAFDFMSNVHHHDRRQVLKVIVGGVATALVLPSKWSKPIVSTILAPAHAQASRPSTTAPPTTVPATTAPPLTTVPVTTAPPPTTVPATTAPPGPS
jgi:hypothetical protein